MCEDSPSFSTTRTCTVSNGTGAAAATAPSSADIGSSDGYSSIEVRVKSNIGQSMLHFILRRGNGACWSQKRIKKKPGAPKAQNDESASFVVFWSHMGPYDFHVVRMIFICTMWNSYATYEFHIVFVCHGTRCHACPWLPGTPQWCSLAPRTQIYFVWWSLVASGAILGRSGMSAGGVSMKIIRSSIKIIRRSMKLHTSPCERCLLVPNEHPGCPNSTRMANLLHFGSFGLILGGFRPTPRGDATAAAV